MNAGFSATFLSTVGGEIAVSEMRRREAVVGGARCRRTVAGPPAICPLLSLLKAKTAALILILGFFYFIVFFKQYHLSTTLSLH